ENLGHAVARVDLPRDGRRGSPWEGNRVPLVLLGNRPPGSAIDRALEVDEDRVPEELCDPGIEEDQLGAQLGHNSLLIETRSWGRCAPEDRRSDPGSPHAVPGTLGSPHHHRIPREEG